MPLSEKDFLDDPEVVKAIAGLKSHFEGPFKKFIVSDVVDAHGHQYVDLVQEGGGVLGIALVGYTYTLEQMGIRFFSMAGTSAGSINTMLLACAGNKEDEKSTRIIENIARLNMFSFVDGIPGNASLSRWIRKFISNMLMGKKPFGRISRTISWVLGSFLFLVIACIALNFIVPSVARWVGIAALLSLIIFVGILIFSVRLFKGFAKNGYGLNEGRTFHEWIKSTISSFTVHHKDSQEPINDLDSFSRHFLRLPPGLVVHPDDRRENNQAPNMPLITLITCDIISERKIEFTRMWDLYWNDPRQVHPGDFVRASMSIPVFFEAYSLTGIRKRSTIEKWKQHLNWQNSSGQIPDTAQFIDGGTLSNFPINVFYNPRYPVPRMPTFGIRLQDGVLDGANQKNGTISSYLMSMFSTIRFNYDRDFITKNRAYDLGVKSIDVQDFNWLNFFLTDPDKIRLFRAGVIAAADFLKKFDWENYKTERWKNFQMQEERFQNPNNMTAAPFSAA